MKIEEIKSIDYINLYRVWLDYKVNKAYIVDDVEEMKCIAHNMEIFSDVIKNMNKMNEELNNSEDFINYLKIK